MTHKDAHQKNLRKGRLSHQGLWYFITTSTKSRAPTLSVPAASQVVMDSLKWMEAQGAIELIAAVIMPDHLHFVVCLRDKDLPSLMHSLKSFTSHKINELLGRQGPLWESQYYDHAIRTEDELKKLVHYCLLNPVRKGLVDNFKEYPHWYCVYEV
jgi:REP element-mobilizing transposase RayT